MIAGGRFKLVDFDVAMSGEGDLAAVGRVRFSSSAPQPSARNDLCFGVLLPQIESLLRQELLVSIDIVVMHDGSAAYPR